MVRDDVQSIAADERGNIWLGTDGGGAARILADGFTTYDLTDGLAGSFISSLSLDALCLFSGLSCVPDNAQTRRVH